MHRHEQLVPLDAASYLADYAGERPGVAGLNSQRHLLSGSPAVFPFSIGEGVQCYYTGFGDEIDCDGIRCQPVYASLRAGSRGSVKANTLSKVGGVAEPVPFSPTGWLGDTWLCNDGGFVVDNGDGTSTYYRRAGSGGGEGDGGSSGGGGTNTCPAGEIWDQYTYGCVPEPTEDELMYCPSSQPKCLKPLSEADSIKVATAIGLVDSTDALCDSARVVLLNRFANKKIFKGDSLIPDGGDDGPHDGNTSPDGRIIHIDEDYFYDPNALVENLASLLVHEAFHATLAYERHTGEKGPVYSKYPFSEAPRCVSSQQ